MSCWWIDRAPCATTTCIRPPNRASAKRCGAARAPTSCGPPRAGWATTCSFSPARRMMGAARGSASSRSTRRPGTRRAGSGSTSASPRTRSRQDRRCSIGATTGRSTRSSSPIGPRSRTRPGTATVPSSSGCWAWAWTPMRRRTISGPPCTSPPAPATARWCGCSWATARGWMPRRRAGGRRGCWRRAKVTMTSPRVCGRPAPQPAERSPASSAAGTSPCRGASRRRSPHTRPRRPSTRRWRCGRRRGRRRAGTAV